MGQSNLTMSILACLNMEREDPLEWVLQWASYDYIKGLLNPD